MQKEIKTVMKAAGFILAALCVAWICWSYADVIAHQGSGGTKAALNFFSLLANAK